jgi:hypothetical protein
MLIDLVRDTVRGLYDADHEKPRVHPNGFLQLDLSDGVRLHVWPAYRDTFPRQSTVNTIHDHKFDMRSTVLKGTLIQKRYKPRIDRPPTHEIWQAKTDTGRNRDNQLVPTGVCVDRGDEVKITYVLEGESYTQPGLTFHDTAWRGLTATLMEKVSIYRDHEPRVLCPLGTPPDNTYDRWSGDVGTLWSLIDEALR